MASALKKWLRKEEIYGKDLEEVLTSQGITDPTKDFKTYTQKQWDELYQKCVVERAKELKDQKSKLRLEKKMTKLEKYWRKQSGIKSTSIKKSDKNKKSKGQSSTNASKSANTNALKTAVALKKYLQKNDCFDKDLLLILSKMDIKSPDDLDKIDSNSKYDDIYRQVRVLRAKELKDNSAKLRLEKLMIKFEKLWRKQTKIAKKSSQNKKTKASKSKLSKSDNGNSKGKELRDWMKKNKIWENALFDELISSGIENENGLKNLNESQFDDIVRRVRVNRFEQLKDQKSRSRVDKLLVSFEKLWRKQSGIKSTSIKDKDKEKMNVSASKHEVVSSSELVPWFLSGKEKKKKNSFLASNPRTAHQKKKDNKLNDKLRESNKCELEWIEIYSRAKYGDYIAPKIEDKYAKHKLRKSQNVEEITEEKDQSDEEPKKDIPNLHEMDLDWNGMVVDECMNMLLLLDESWEGRISILNALIDQLCDEKCTEDEYACKLCKFLCCVGAQFADPRSLIIQAMEQCISRLAKATPNRFIVFAPYILESLFCTFPVRIEALRDPGIKLGKFLIGFLNEYDTNYVLLRTVFKGLDSKQAAVRTECADYTDFMIRKIGLLEKENESDELEEADKVLMADIDAAVRKACKDASSEARMNGYRALTQYKKIAPKAAQEIIDKMTKAQITKFEEANKEPHYE